MPGNSTMLPTEKWATQRVALQMPDRCFECASRFDCSVTTLAAFAREHGLDRIDLLKVDVEGAELEVLRGMDAGSWAVTRRVVAEVHDVGQRLAQVQALLAAQGFAVAAEPGLPGNWLVRAHREV